MTEQLKFSPGNAKIDDLSTQEIKDLALDYLEFLKVRSLSIPSGHACPFASQCKSKAVVDPDTGQVRIVDGHNTRWRCFSSSQEARLPSVRNQRWHNWQLIRQDRTASAIAKRILADLPPRTGVIRIHIGGDFYSQAYFDAWIRVAEARPRMLFYAYTKSLVYWVRRLDAIPVNLVLTASYGGKRDDLIARHNLRSATVVYSEAKAEALGLPIDHDDRMAMDRRIQKFALLLHGPQPKGSEASQARSKLARQGWQGYSRE